MSILVYYPREYVHSGSKHHPSREHLYNSLFLASCRTSPAIGG
jgi:hypothetical protein